MIQAERIIFLAFVVLGNRLGNGREAPKECFSPVPPKKIPSQGPTSFLGGPAQIPDTKVRGLVSSL
jgi:hypothetical protein